MHLTTENYNYIFSQVPRLCIDLLIYKKSKILLGKRTHEPFLGQWALPGSRLKFGETIQDAIERILANELGYLVTPVKTSLVGYVDFSNEIKIVGRHSVSMVFSMECSDFFIFNPTDSFSKVGFFEECDFENIEVLKNHLDFLFR